MEVSLKTMILKLTLTLVAAGLAFAQSTTTRTPPDPATIAKMRVNRLAAELKLTDAQQTSAVGIFTTAIASEQSVQTQLQTNHTSLAAAIKSNNTATIDQLSTAAGTLQGQLAAIEGKAEAAFYALLTAEQKTLYDAMPHGGPGGPGGRGFGGPGGGPGGMMRGRRG
jgi:Spy/CpxP family protein refolding chaperone